MSTKITHAVIPVAGFGTRMLPLSKAVPKELLPLGNKPAIQYVVEEAIAAGLTNIVLVNHAQKTAIENYFETCRKIGKEPEKPFKGAFNLRLDPSLHELLVAGALSEGKTLNAFVKDVLKKAVSVTHA